MTAPVHLAAEVEEHAYRAWRPAETEEVHGWRLHAAGGFSRRVNSASPPSTRAHMDEALASAAAWYARRGLPLVARITPLSFVVDAALQERGFVEEGFTDVMVADLDPGRRERRVEVESHPVGAWLRAQERLQGVPAELSASWEGIIGRIAPPAAFGLIRESGDTVAAGFAVADGAWLGLFEINVAATHRRRGLGRALSGALLDWGAGAGARRGYLQVLGDNRAGRALYRSLGFTPAYRYWYRRAP